MGRAIYRAVALDHIVMVLGHCGRFLVAVAGAYTSWGNRVSRTPRALIFEVLKQNL